MQANMKCHEWLEEKLGEKLGEAQRRGGEVVGGLEKVGEG